MNIYAESIKPYKTFSGWFIRVWRRKLSSDGPVEDADVANVLSKLDEETSDGVIAKSVLELRDVNAVEVKNEKGFGVVLYKDWP